MNVDVDSLEAGGTFAVIGFFTASAMCYFWRGKVSANGVTLLPTWLIQGFGWLLVAGLLFAGYESGWKT